MVGGRDAGVVPRQGAGPGARVPGVPRQPGPRPRAGRSAYRRAAELGADMAAADAAVVADGPAPMGPFALGDLIGLDTLGHIQRDLQAAYGDRFGDGGRDRRGAWTPAASARSPAPASTTATAPEAEPPTRPAARWPPGYYASALDEARRCIEEESPPPATWTWRCATAADGAPGRSEWARSTEASPAG